MLFDEIEKAHPAIFNIFLQILDEGQLTDGQGRNVSFKNCIIIMTSNIGSQTLLESKEIDEKVKDKIMKLVHKAFKPEFINRIDAIVFFKALTEEDIEKIAKIQLEKLTKRLAEKNIEIVITDNVIKEVAKLGYSKEFGARPLKREIQNFVAVPLSRFLLKNPQAILVKVDVQNGVLVIYG